MNLIILASLSIRLLHQSSPGAVTIIFLWQNLHPIDAAPANLILHPSIGIMLVRVIFWPLLNAGFVNTLAQDGPLPEDNSRQLAVFVARTVPHFPGRHELG